MSDTVSASSLKNLEVRLTMSIDAAMQAEADLNILRSKAGMEPAEKRFFLAAEARIAVREAVAEAKAGTKAEPKPYSWRNPPPAAAPPASDHYSPVVALRTIVAALRHPGLTSEDWPASIRLGVDHGDARAALSQNRRHNGGGGGLPRPALGRTECDHRHRLLPRVQDEAHGDAERLPDR
jgi:hypothetical protein